MASKQREKSQRANHDWTNRVLLVYLPPHYPRGALYGIVVILAKHILALRAFSAIIHSFHSTWWWCLLKNQASGECAQRCALFQDISPPFVHRTSVQCPGNRSFRTSVHQDIGSNKASNPQDISFLRHQPLWTYVGPPGCMLVPQNVCWSPRTNVRRQSQVVSPLGCNSGP